MDDSNGNMSTGGDVVNAHLVCFRDVSELQQQNQKLLHSIRELSERVEEADKVALDRHLREIQVSAGRQGGAWQAPQGDTG